MALSDIWNRITPYLSDVIVAVVVLLIGIIVARVLERVVERALRELDLDRWLRKLGIRFPLGQTLAVIVKYVIYVAAIVVALNQVGLSSFVINLIAAIALILIIAGVFLGVKDFIPNFIAGIRIHRRGFVKEGDRIRVRNIEGEVREISLTETRIKTPQGDILFVPNSLLIQHEVLRHGRKKTMLR